MNEVILKGIIRDITPSHTLNGVEYEQASVIITRDDGKDDIIPIKFKKFSNRYKEGDKVVISGNIRSYSRKLDNGKSKVQLYVFTYFDSPSTNNDYEDVENEVNLDGRICKVDEIRTTESGKSNLHLIIANNIISLNNSQKLNNYIPSVLWGRLAIENQDLKVNDVVRVKGRLHSRLYQKKISDDEIELRTAYELIIKEIERVNEEDF